jgi:hypothetical protein
MKQALVKISTELYGPGAVIRNKTLDWIAQWEFGQTRRVLYPAAPLPSLLNPGQDRSLVVKDFAHIRFIAIDDIYAGPLDSELDVILASIRLDYFLGPELSRIANTALQKAPPYTESVTYAGWMELWEFDPAKGNGYALREVTMQQIVERTQTA